MSATWRMDVFLWTSCVVNLPLVQGMSAVQLCGSGLLADEISNLLRSPPSLGNLRPQTTVTGDRLCRVVSERQRREKTNGRRRRESVEEKGHRLLRLYFIKLSTPVPRLVTVDVVQNIDVTYGAAPLSFEIDGF